MDLFMSNNHKNSESCIKCNVETCKHHNRDNKCMAGKITVANENSRNCTDTFCSTFASKAEDSSTMGFTY